MKKIIVLAACLVSINVYAKSSPLMYQCTYTVESQEFNKVYSTTGHIITSTQNGVYDARVLGLPFASISGTYPEANVYTFRINGNKDRLLLQIIDKNDSAVSVTKIFNVGDAKPSVRLEVENAGLRLECKEYRIDQ